MLLQTILGVLQVLSKSIRSCSHFEGSQKDWYSGLDSRMAEIATLTFNQYAAPSPLSTRWSQADKTVSRLYRGDFVEIIEMLDKRLNDKGKNWRHVFKSLTVLDYILHAGSENVVHYFRWVDRRFQYNEVSSTEEVSERSTGRIFTLSRRWRSFNT